MATNRPVNNNVVWGGLSHEGDEPSLPFIMFVLSPFEKIFSFFSFQWVEVLYSKGMATSEAHWLTSVFGCKESRGMEMSPRRMWQQTGKKTQAGEASAILLYWIYFRKKQTQTQNQPDKNPNHATSCELVQDTDTTSAPKSNQLSLQTAQTRDAWHRTYWCLGMNKIKSTYTSHRFPNLMIFSFGFQVSFSNPWGSMGDHWELTDKRFNVSVQWSAPLLGKWKISK